MKKKTAILAAASALAMLAAGCSGTSEADTAESTAAEITTIRVAGTGVSFPNSYEEDGELVGFETDIVNAAAEKLGWEVEWSTIEFSGLLQAIKTNKIDTSATNVTKTAEREEQFSFSEVYAYDGVAAAVRNDSGIETLEDLDGATLGSSAGSTNIDLFEQWAEIEGVGLTMRGYDSFSSALSDAELGRIEGVAGPMGSVQVRIAESDMSIVGDPISREVAAFPFNNSEEGQQMAEQWSTALAELREEGTLTELSEKYFGYDRTVEPDWWGDPVVLDEEQ